MEEGGGWEFSMNPRTGKGAERLQEGKDGPETWKDGGDRGADFHLPEEKTPNDEK